MSGKVGGVGDTKIDVGKIIKNSDNYTTEGGRVEKTFINFLSDMCIFFRNLHFFLLKILTNDNSWCNRKMAKNYYYFLHSFLEEQSKNCEYYLRGG